MGERSGLARAGKEVCVQGVRAVLVERGGRDRAAWRGGGDGNTKSS